MFVVALEAYGMAVPDIMPLETLHNSLTLAHFEKFLTNVIDMGTITPKRSYMGASNSLNGSRGGLLSYTLCSASKLNYTLDIVYPVYRDTVNIRRDSIYNNILLLFFSL